jgi:diguanylate cyclase (GGDEF)-like protein
MEIVDTTSILLLDPLGTDGPEIAEMLEPFGYALTTVRDVDALRDAMAKLDASHILVRLRDGAVDGSLLDQLGALDLNENDTAPALVFISDDASVPTRIQAVRVGAQAFVIPPLNALSLVDRLEGLNRNGRAEPYRIMIVDDDVMMSKYYKTILAGAAMDVLVVNEPMNVVQHLSDFRPELILMDHYMPEVQGRELAAVIRQEAAYDSIPIVFLSAEDDAATQQRVMGIGADDFLNKSIRPEHLISAVGNRARRFRALRATMLRDSLTGLLNHTATKEQLAIDIARMARTGKPLTFCLLDLDNFKHVNDSYGHPAGDRVLRAMAHLLKQRLRVSDVIGRYGGEEFAIALADTSIEDARRVFDEIRESFFAIPQSCEGGTFNVSFSAGLASYPQAGNATRLTEAADKALYRAKHQGRNRVALAGVAEYGAVADEEDAAAAS